MKYITVMVCQLACIAATLYSAYIAVTMNSEGMGWLAFAFLCCLSIPTFANKRSD